MSMPAEQLLQSAAASLAIDSEAVSPQLKAAALLYLTGRLPADSFFHKVKAYGKPAGYLLLRQVQLLQAGVFDCSVEGLLHLHATLYGDIAADAGTLRKVDLQLHGSNFTDYKYLRGSLRSVLSRMQSEQGNPAVGKADFAARLAHYMRELHILSPFSQGNGLTRRTFCALFASARGFVLHYAAVPCRLFAQAEMLAFTADNVQKLYDCLTAALSYDSDAESPAVSAPQRLRAGTSHPTPSFAPRTVVRRPPPPSLQRQTPPSSLFAPTPLPPRKPGASDAPPKVQKAAAPDADPQAKQTAHIKAVAAKVAKLQHDADELGKELHDLLRDLT